jgi:hypothetical protein
VQVKLEEEVAAQRRKLEAIHHQKITSLTQSGFSQLEELRAQHKREISELKSRHEAALRAKRSNNEESIKKEVEAKLQEAKLHLEVECTKRLSDKDAEIIAIKASCERTILQLNETWEARKAEELKSFRRELEHHYEETIDQLKLAHREEVKNSEMMRKKFLAQTKILTQENDAKKEVIESKNSMLATLSKECDNHLAAMEACKLPYIGQIVELNEEIKKKKVIISDLEGQVRLRAAAVEEGKDLRRKLEAEHQGKVLLLQKQLSESATREEVLNASLASLKAKLDASERETKLSREHH